MEPYYYSAYVFFKAGNYANAVLALHTVDPSYPYPSWDISDPASLLWCYDPDNLPSILSTIERGLRQ